MGEKIYLNTKKVEKVRKPSWIISILKFVHVFGNQISSFLLKPSDTNLGGQEMLQILPN